jgi:gas vesicle protein GvpL/GvpF
MKFIILGIHLREGDIEPVTNVMAVAGLFASAVGVDDDRPLADRDLLVEIANVRAKLLDRATFVAVRYGFSVRDENELAAKCADRTTKWRELLIAHRDEVEMTLKAPAAAPAARPNRRDFDTGSAYLRALYAATYAVDVDGQFRACIERTLVPRATQHRWIRDSASVELAMLVRRNDLDAVRDAGEQLRRDFASVPFLLSGPWPLEVFASDDHQQ